jgi:hypothetical protein
MYYLIRNLQHFLRVCSCVRPMTWQFYLKRFLFSDTNVPFVLTDTVGYARSNVFGSGTSFVTASVRSSIHCNIRI